MAELSVLMRPEACALLAHFPCYATQSIDYRIWPIILSILPYCL